VKFAFEPAAFLVVWGLTFGAGLAVESCTPAQSATWAQIEQTVLADVENGSALSVIEAAVVAIDPAAAAVAGLVDQIIVEAIDLAEDTGALPVVDGGASYAKTVKGQAMAKMLAAQGRK
jgi:hypothetical protein